MSEARRILVTGGAGFIGSALVRRIIRCTPHHVLNVDKLTYAGNLESLAQVAPSPRYAFSRTDICDARALRALFARFRPHWVMHLAAESHVDRSIDGPAEFISTNIVGTFTLLHEALEYWRGLDASERATFRFHHVSTDEVFGSLGTDGFFTESTPYQPRSPYSASKAAADHLVRAWQHTFGLPVVLSNCSNNYGPYHFPEKLVPLTVINGILCQPLPVYGKGENVRDWLYVDDHAEALLAIVESGRVGESYNVGGMCERRNIELVRTICALLDELLPDPRCPRREQLIEFVADRPGHDHRYAIDPTKVTTQLGWRPRETLESGLRKTVQWYLENRSWWERVRSGSYRGERLGLSA